MCGLVESLVAQWGQKKRRDKILAGSIKLPCVCVFDKILADDYPDNRREKIAHRSQRNRIKLTNDIGLQLAWDLMAHPGIVERFEPTIDA